MDRELLARRRWVMVAIAAAWLGIVTGGRVLWRGAAAAPASAIVLVVCVMTLVAVFAGYLLERRKRR